MEALSLWRRANLSVGLGGDRTEIVRVEALSCAWRRANLSRTLCRDHACRSALALAPFEFALTPNPLRKSSASKRSRCGAERICLDLSEPSAEIVCVEELSLWRRANFLAFAANGL